MLSQMATVEVIEPRRGPSKFSDFSRLPYILTPSVFLTTRYLGKKGNSMANNTPQ